MYIAFRKSPRISPAQYHMAIVGLMLAVATAAPPAHAQLFGGKIDLHDVHEDPLEPPVRPDRPTCATDAENAELAGLRDSWQSAYDAYRQALAAEDAASKEMLDAAGKEVHLWFELGAARGELNKAQSQLANARTRHSSQIPDYFQAFEAALAKVTSLRTAHDQAAAESARAHARFDASRAARLKALQLVREAKSKYEALEKKLNDRKSCPPPSTSMLPATPTGQFPLRSPGVPGSVADRWSGINVGVFTTVSASQLDITERFALTGVQTNAFGDSSTRAGGGISVGYNTVVQDRYLFGVLVDVSAPDAVVSHPFPPSPFFISSTQNVTVDILGRAGILAAPNLLIYGQAGAVVANNRLQISFGGVPTDESRTTVAAAIGGGAEIKLPWMASGGMVFGSPSLFIDYLHGFQSNAKLNQPDASSLFNYDFDRETNTFKVGLRFQARAAPPPPPPPPR